MSFKANFKHAPVSAGIIFHLLFSWILIVAILVWAPPVFSGDTETARNYLNTIAGTLSTILALCISLVMVAIQLTASKYSHRVLDFFIRLPYNASLLSFYLLTIFHSIYVLSKVRDFAYDPLPFWLDQAMSADLFLLIFCFLALLVYMFAIMKLLNPETIVRAIAREYMVAYRHSRYDEAVDKMEQIADIGKRCLSDMDASTAIVSVEYLAQMMHQTRMPTAESDAVLWYHRKIVHLLLGIASIAFKERETSISSAILDEFFDIGERYAETGSLKAAGMILEAYEWIIMNNLIGEKQHSLIERVIEQTFQMTCEIVKREQGEEQLHKFVLRSFRTLRRIGQQILKTEVFGNELVAKQIVSKMFGELLATIIEKNGPAYPKTLIRELLHEYMKLSRLLLMKSEAKEIVRITTWLREEMLPHRENRMRVYPFLYLYTLLGASALYLNRKEMVTILIRAIGKYFPPDQTVLRELQEERMQVRAFFDFHEPERYLSELYVLWDAYHRYAAAHQEDDRKALDLSSSAIRNRKAWYDLFDGKPLEQFLQTEHQGEKKGWE
ncbi:hypothetical protein DNHGIG_30620 [Collibacillus ludicampi]|uniref:DUF2254 domain-containing protein n=1 Tax=Collibacillus ludicampi TaxID=2771369 RepID=A0AAV4LIC1_9BACL|nr:DUF2254 family protein [Collibacillus ludicampi]GIM47513.1 hypothetical protein DNHGIG_30620 [Collibacillus ludicampi]